MPAKSYRTYNFCNGAPRRSAVEHSASRRCVRVCSRLVALDCTCSAFELGLAFCFRDWVRGQTGGPLGRAGGGGVNVTAPLQFLGPNSAIPNSCNSNLQSQFRIGAQSQYQFPHWGPNVNWGPFPGALQLHRAHLNVCPIGNCFNSIASIHSIRIGNWTSIPGAGAPGAIATRSAHHRPSSRAGFLTGTSHTFWKIR